MSETVHFRCPQEMFFDVKAIWDHGEYDIPIDFAEPPRVLDIGANIGAFALWAMQRWPGAQVTCYEPNPKALEFLRPNVKGKATVVEAAVATNCGTAVLYQGTSNLGSAGFTALPDSPGSLSTVGELVATDAARDLLLCEILKIDTEGCELEILEGYDLSATVAVMLEFHRKDDRHAIEALLAGQGFELYSGLIRQPWLGTLRFVRRP